MVPPYMRTYIIEDCVDGFEAREEADFAWVY